MAAAVLVVEVGSGLQTKTRAPTTTATTIRLEVEVAAVSEVVLPDLQMHRGALAVLWERRARFPLVAVPRAVPQTLAGSDPPRQFLVLLLLRSVVDRQRRRRRLRFRIPMPVEEEE